MPFRRATTFVLAFLAGPALADCPTTNDLTHGIFVTYDDGSISRLTRYDDGSIFEDITYTDGSLRFASVLEGGFLAVRVFDITNGVVPARSIVETSFSGGDTDIDTLDPGESRLLDYSRIELGGPSQGTVTIAKDAATELSIGECRTTAFPVTLTERRENGSFIMRLFWLPDPGVPILRQTEDSSNGNRYSVRATALDANFPISR